MSKTPPQAGSPHHRIRAPGATNPGEYSWRTPPPPDAPTVPPLQPPVPPVVQAGCPDFVELAKLSEEACKHLEAAAAADMRRDFAERDAQLEGVTGSAGIVDGCARARLSFLLSDPNQPGHPITYASPSFLELTGFTSEECRRLNETQQLHGPETEVESLMACARALQEGTPLSVRLRIYNKARTPFWSQWWLTPLTDSDGTIQHWLGVFLSDTDHAGDSTEDEPPSLWVPREVTPDAPNTEEVECTMAVLAQKFDGEDSELLRPVTRSYVARCYSTANAMKRTFEANLAKIVGICDWRLQAKPWTITEQQVESTLKCGALAWSGFTTKGSPVLYARPGKIQKVDPRALEMAHVWALERGLQLMPPGVCGFAVVVDTSGLGMHHLSTELCRLLLPLVTVGYAGRMDACVAGPTTSIASAAWRILKSLLPGNVASRISVCKSPRAALLNSGLLRASDIPDFVK